MLTHSHDSCVEDDDDDDDYAPLTSELAQKPDFLPHTATRQVYKLQIQNFPSSRLQLGRRSFNLPESPPDPVSLKTIVFYDRRCLQYLLLLFLSFQWRPFSWMILKPLVAHIAYSQRQVDITGIDRDAKLFTFFVFFKVNSVAVLEPVKCGNLVPRAASREQS